MNLFATLLFSHPIHLPVGTARFISADGLTRAAPAEETTAQSEQRTKNETIRLGNIESVFRCIETGKNTIYKISDSANLSVSTVKKALSELEDHDRIVRDSSKSQHSFTVKSKA